MCNQLEYLKLNDYYNKPIEKLPLTLTHLIFGVNSKYNHPIKCLSQLNNLIHLEFGSSYNQSLNELHNSLEFLDVGVGYSQVLDNLPVSLIHLIYSSNFSHTINNLPSQLEYLFFR